MQYLFAQSEGGILTGRARRSHHLATRATGSHRQPQMPGGGLVSLVEHEVREEGGKDTYCSESTLFGLSSLPCCTHATVSLQHPSVVPALCYDPCHAPPLLGCTAPTYPWHSFTLIAGLPVPCSSLTSRTAPCPNLISLPFPASLISFLDFMVIFDIHLLTDLGGILCESHR